MWRVWVFIGAVVWIMTAASSAAVNYLAGYELGRSAAEAHVFALLGIAADTWKATGPIFITQLWRARKTVAVSLATIVWITCFMFAVSAALGFAARNRSTIVGMHDVLRMQLEAVLRDLADEEKKRADLGSSGHAPELEAAIKLELAKPLPGGTVASLSEDCSKDHWRARPGCERIAELRRDIARAVEGRRLDERIDTLKRERNELQSRGALRESDPQATLISRLTFGRIPAGDVGLLVTLLLACVVELISGFTPVVVHEYALVSRPVAQGRSQASLIATGHGASERLSAQEPVPQLPAPAETVGSVYEYIADRVQPDAAGEVTLAALHDDYVRWCGGRAARALGATEFASELDRIGEQDLGGMIRRHADLYRGLRIRH